MEPQTPTFVLTQWRVRDGLGPQFEEAWETMGQAAERLPGVSLDSVLLRSLESPLHYQSIDHWAQEAHMRQAQGDHGFRQALQEATSHCERMRRHTALAVARRGARTTDAGTA